MRRLVVFFALIASLGAVSPTARAQKMAVWRIDPLGIDSAIVARLRGLLRVELARIASASMVSPLSVAKLASRPALRSCTGEVACLVRAGKQLKVDRIISGNVGGLGDSYVVNMKLVDVGRRREVRRVQETISGTPGQLIEAVRLAAYRLIAPDRLKGSLALLANVAGADVRIDGKLRGTTPLELQRNLPIGKHTIRVSKLGYVDVVQTVAVRFQKTAHVVVTMEVPQKGADGGTMVPRKVYRPYPWYTRWWFWTAVGIVAAGVGVGVGYALSANPSVNCGQNPGACGL
jgi:hypothetical protein